MSRVLMWPPCRLFIDPVSGNTHTLSSIISYFYLHKGHENITATSGELTFFFSKKSFSVHQLRVARGLNSIPLRASGRRIDHSCVTLSHVPSTS